MPVLPEDTEQYNRFVIDQVKTLESVVYDPEDIVWHYTNGPGLIGILESGTIYATQVACLNDSTEIRYAIKLFVDALTELKGNCAGDKECCALVERLLGLYKEDPALPNHAPSRFFVACFSKLEDDLNQWRAYGTDRGENGYAIGFRARGLADQHGGLLRVSYDKAKHKTVATEVAKATLRFFRDGLTKNRAATPEKWAEEFLLAWDECIARLAPVVKDDCFKAEEEFRLVHELHVSEFGKIRFKQKETLLSRHLPISFPTWMQLRYPIMPIAKVIVGPGKHQHITRISVRALLGQLGYSDIPVEISQRPLQRT